MAHIVVIGLGEAGSVYAQALAADGHRVRGVDPGPVETPGGVERVETLPDDAPIDAVFVLTSARAASALAEDVLPSLAADTVWVDMTTASPGQKQTMSARRTDVRYVDIAILGPVVLQGIHTPLLAAGEGAELVRDLLSPLGSPVEIVPDGRPGDAMAHKLLRSVFMKGLASVVTEAVAAGIAAGREDWVRGQVAAQLAGDGEAVVERFLTGTVKHAARRADEMDQVVGYLGELGVEAVMSRATAAHLHGIVAGTHQGS